MAAENLYFEAFIKDYSRIYSAGTPVERSASDTLALKESVRTSACLRNFLNPRTNTLPCIVQHLHEFILRPLESSRAQCLRRPTRGAQPGRRRALGRRKRSIPAAVRL